MDANKVSTKRNFVQQAQDNCRLVKWACPLWDQNSRSMPLDAYKDDLLVTKANSNKFSNISGTLHGVTMVNKLKDDFYIYYQVKMLFSTTPTYQKYTNLDITYRKMISYNYPLWSNLE